MADTPTESQSHTLHLYSQEPSRATHYNGSHLLKDADAWPLSL